MADETPSDIAGQMQSRRFQALRKAIAQANAHFGDSEKASEAGQMVGAALSKSGWGAVILNLVKGVIKIINLFAGEIGVAFFVTTFIIWVITFPMHLIIDIVPIVGPLVTWAFCAILAIPSSAYIYPKVKPFVDGILKGSSIVPVKK